MLGLLALGMDWPAYRASNEPQTEPLPVSERVLGWLIVLSHSHRTKLYAKAGIIQHSFVSILKNFLDKVCQKYSIMSFSMRGWNWGPPNHQYWAHTPISNNLLPLRLSNIQCKPSIPETESFNGDLPCRVANGDTVYILRFGTVIIIGWRYNTHRDLAHRFECECYAYVSITY